MEIRRFKAVRRRETADIIGNHTLVFFGYGRYNIVAIGNQLAGKRQFQIFSRGGVRPRNDNHVFRAQEVAAAAARVNGRLPQGDFQDFLIVECSHKNLRNAAKGSTSGYF